MTGRYDDIIHLSHHVSPIRKRMSAAGRAAQFSPFAALTGYDDAILETARLTDGEAELASDETAILNEKLRYLADHLDEEMEVTILHFIPDTRKSGGAYVQTRGIVRRIDGQNQQLIMADGSGIPFARIYDLSFSDGGSPFDQPEGSCICSGDEL